MAKYLSPLLMALCMCTIGVVEYIFYVVKKILGGLKMLLLRINYKLKHTLSSSKYCK